MSKASEWVRLSTLHRPKPLVVPISANRTLEWNLGEDGGLYLCTPVDTMTSPVLAISASIKPEDVQALVAWIMDTFGETE